MVESWCELDLLKLLIKIQVKPEELNLNYDNYLKRKKQYAERISVMINYATGKDCKSSFIGIYFGDKNIESCGKCDCCLEKKKTKTTTEVFKKTHHEILKALELEKMEIESLVLATGAKKEILIEVIKEMKDENKIGIDINGNLFLK
jgi:ATP-dependent DNA helicase RecQ